MIEYMKFWVAQFLVEFGIGMGFVALIILIVLWLEFKK